MQESHKHMDDDVDLEAEIERELEQAEKERLAMAAAKRRPKLLEVRSAIHHVSKNTVQICFRQKFCQKLSKLGLVVVVEIWHIWRSYKTELA